MGLLGSIAMDSGLFLLAEHFHTFISTKSNSVAGEISVPIKEAETSDQTRG